MRSTMPRTRTVSCADAGKASEMRTKLEAANAHGNFPTMTNLQRLPRCQCNTGISAVFQRERHDAAARCPAAASLPLLHGVGAGLANRRILIAGSAAAADGADHLAVFDQ